MKKKILCIIIVLLVLLSFLATVSLEWLYNTFGHLTMDEIVFHMKVPMEGTNSDTVFKYIWQCIPIIIICSVVVSFILIYPILKDIKIRKKKVNTSQNSRTKWISLVLAMAVFVACCVRIFNVTDMKEYFENQLEKSEFIEQEYIDPKNVNIQFPENKRNLIYIYLESMENTYCSKESGGLAEKSLIPEIEKLAKENINFSNNEKIGGAYSIFGTTWTVGSMTAQCLGVPLKIGIEDDWLSGYNNFLTGGYGLGEILEKEGYHNYLLLGSDANFGGRRGLYEGHGNYEIWDVHSAFKEEKLKDWIWWGYNDELLFTFAKEKITNLAKENRPFNFTMLTVDTHFPDGFSCSDCEDKWGEQYKNVISCSSKKVGEFIKWIKEQSFYENTTIVLVGDHLTMQKDFFELEEGQDYEKTVVSIIINSAIQATNTKNRKYSTMDFLPTTLAALGTEIDGNKLALGVNLFSEEKTLLEKYGREYVETELKKVSEFYDEEILK